MKQKKFLFSGVAILLSIVRQSGSFLKALCGTMLVLAIAGCASFPGASNQSEAASVPVDKGSLKVVDRVNLEKIREEQGFQLSGEVNDASAKAIGQLLGTGAIVTGSLLNIGDEYRFTLKAINIESTEVAMSYPADIANDRRVQALLPADQRLRLHRMCRQLLLFPSLTRSVTRALRAGLSSTTRVTTKADGGIWKPRRRKLRQPRMGHA
jgi:hypothetical protein